MGNTTSRLRCSHPVCVVLVGGGHANVQVLKYLSENFVIDKEKGLRLVLVSDYPEAFYSGMLPGSISELYTPKQIQIDLPGLCKWCGAEFICDKLLSINWNLKELICKDTKISFDFTCINIGSETKLSELNGVKEHAITTRPISELLVKIEQRDEQLQQIKQKTDRERKVVVVGSGAAGLELAWAFRTRLEAKNQKPNITLVHAGDKPIFEDISRSVSANIHEKLKEHKIKVTRGKAIEVFPSHILLSTGKELQYDYLIWATGAKPPSVISNLGVEQSENGYIQVNQYLQSTSNDSLFAVGDCCNFQPMKLPKAGVYSVREGPIVGENIKNSILGEPLVPYEPQKGFLALLNTSDGKAIASYKGASLSGHMAMTLKDKIDQKFMNSFNPAMLGDSPQVNS